MKMTFAQRMDVAKATYRTAVEKDGRMTAFGKGFKSFFVSQQPHAEEATGPKREMATLARLKEIVSRPKGTAAFAGEMAARGEIADAIGEHASALKDIWRTLAALEGFAKDQRTVMGDDEKTVVRRIIERIGTSEVSAVAAELRRIANERIVDIEGLVGRLSSTKNAGELEEAARVLDNLFKNAPGAYAQRLGGRAKISLLLGEGLVNSVRPRIDALPDRARKENEIRFILPIMTNACICTLAAVRHAVREENMTVLENASDFYAAALALMDKPIFRPRIEEALGKAESDALFASGRALTDTVKVCSFLLKDGSIGEVFQLAGNEGSKLVRLHGIMNTVRHV
jgi:hypothetical protein